MNEERIATNDVQRSIAWIGWVGAEMQMVGTGSFFPTCCASQNTNLPDEA